MKIFGYETNKEKRTSEFRSLYDNYVDPVYGGLAYSSYGGFTSTKSLTLSAVFRAVNLISDSIASLQLKVYDVDGDGYTDEAHSNTLYSILGVEPNSNMGRFNFFKLIIEALLLRGNAYIKINRDNNFNVTSLVFINPDNVTISNKSNEVKYLVNGISGVVNSSDMIHILNFPQLNSPYGASTITYASNSLDIAYNSENHAGNWFKGGANFSALVTHDNILDSKQTAQLIKSMKAMQDPTTGNPNGVALLPGLINPKLNTLGISPRDSQLIETRAYNVKDIARFFNINSLLLDNTSGTYNNVENAQLDLYINTLQPYIEKIENEFTRKLILPSQRKFLQLKFDVSNNNRMDSSSKIAYYKGLFEMGVINANYIAKMENLPKIIGEGGDRFCISTNLQDSNNLIVNQNNSIDNKLL